jgi:hypothetical protein
VVVAMGEDVDLIVSKDARVRVGEEHERRASYTIICDVSFQDSSKKL